MITKPTRIIASKSREKKEYFVWSVVLIIFRCRVKIYETIKYIKLSSNRK